MANKEKAYKSDLAKWLELETTTFYNIVSGNRRPHPKVADVLEEKTGIPLRDWLLGDPKKLLINIQKAYSKHLQKSDH